MLKKLTLSLLIAILPIQSLAVVDMSLQKQALQFGSTAISPQDSHHPCHQELLCLQFVYGFWCHPDH
jgi:hypothetical protein